MIIEWNAHMFSRDTERYPFHPRAAYVPDPRRWSDDPHMVSSYGLILRTYL